MRELFPNVLSTVSKDLRGAFIVIAAVISVMGVAACSPTLDWRDWRPADSGLTLTLPCKPTPQARNVQLAGQSVRMSLHACSAGGQTWALAYADMGDPRLLGPALAELRLSAAANVAASSNRALPPLVIAGATPHPESGRWALEGKLADGKSIREELAVFARGTVVFQATVLGETLPPEGVAMFFESLRAQP